MVTKTKEDKRRKWIISLGFSEAEADSFIEFQVPNRKIEALAEVLHKPEPVAEAKPESVAATEPGPAPEQSEAKAPDQGEGFGDTVPNA